MDCKWIIGAGPFLDLAYEAWQRSFQNLQIEKISITQNSSYDFDLNILDAISPTRGTAFVAFDEKFANFKRLELVAKLMERGFKLEPFISPHAMLASNVQIGPNAFIGDSTIVGLGSRIGYNTVLLPGVTVGVGVHIHSSCWVESGITIGNGAQIGTHCTLRMGTMIAPKIKIGRNCDLGWAQRYDKDVAAKTTFDPRYDSPIYTYF